ncbi:Ribophorin I [Protomyces lactucae-debilis]|uniref:Dolichyl-diphosphooligosaccharide--protein glycosyltransferase subunit 1 n=1 Tax=Protomyces lactucae-debilis TaxID=2754530 RepID=A0A1Y2FIQ8_PROLT|nr:Ribophorin I [Protomyces lactucae-debilis]ORY82695.1 Ribophorin I [Protomyces lactucae-debilis]
MRMPAPLKWAAAVFLGANALTSVPQHWQITNALRTIGLTHSFVTEQVAVIIENISSKPQTVFYVPLAATGSHLEAKVKTKTASTDLADNLLVNKDEQHWAIELPSALPAGQKITLSLSSSRLHKLKPKPSTMDQTGKQFLEYTFETRVSSPYKTLKQKTKLKLPNGNIKEHTGGGEVSDSTVSYGPYEHDSSSAADEVAKIRFEHTAPLTVVKYFERDIDVSHWGGNIAFEDRYSVTNDAARLRKQFDRIEFSSRQRPGPSSAIKAMAFKLPKGTRDVYYTDEIGNVSTSRFRKNKFDAQLEITPRYPIFGNWNYTFTLGWNNNLGRFMTKSGNQHYLRVPFMEGVDNVAYDDVLVKVILPEGAKIKQIETYVPHSKETRGVKKTFMDTVGRTVVAFEASDLTDDLARRELLIAYEYTTADHLRKPLVVTLAIGAIFALSIVANKIL